MNLCLIEGIPGSLEGSEWRRHREGRGSLIEEKNTPLARTSLSRAVLTIFRCDSISWKNVRSLTLGTGFILFDIDAPFHPMACLLNVMFLL